jgi:hypothetical protein
MSKKPLCAWTFERASNCPYNDPLIARFKAMLVTYGFCFPEKNNVPEKIVKMLNAHPALLTREEWGKTGYPFLKPYKDVLIKLYNGQTEFGKKEREDLEAICGDFFDLNGKPRYKKGATQKVAPFNKLRMAA